MRIPFTLLLILLTTTSALSTVEVAPRISDKEIIERLTRLEEGQNALKEEIKALDKRMDDLRSEMNGRFNDLRSEMNGRFNDMNARFDTLQWMIGLYVTISLVTLGFVLRMQWQMHRRLVRVETTLETQKDELAFLKGLIEKLLPRKEVL